MGDLKKLALGPVGIIYHFGHRSIRMAAYAHSETSSIASAESCQTGARLPKWAAYSQMAYSCSRHCPLERVVDALEPLRKNPSASVIRLRSRSLIMGTQGSA